MFEYFQSDLPTEQQSQSDSSDEMHGSWAQTGLLDLQNNLKMNLPLRTCRTTGSNFGFENIDNTFKQPESPLFSIPNFSGVSPLHFLFNFFNIL